MISCKKICLLCINLFCLHTIEVRSSFSFVNVKNNTGFTCNQIAGDKVEVGYGHNVIIDSSGVIKAVNDGKITPLMLGSIPSKSFHIDQLKNSGDGFFNPHASVGLFTLNEGWECKKAGLSKLVKKDKQIEQRTYPTKDMTAPSFIDLLRAVRDLEKRDAHNHQVVLVHCKAGRGRSATVVAAYLLHVIHKSGKATTLNQVEAYLVTHRKQVRLHEVQKKAVEYFYGQLKQAGGLDNLCKKHKVAITQRDQELGSF